MGTGEIRGNQPANPLKTTMPGVGPGIPGLTKTAPLGAPPPPKPGDTAKLTDAAKAGQKQPNQDLASYPLPKRDIEGEVQSMLADPANRGVVGEAVAYWHDLRKDDGPVGYLAAAMETLLEFSGLPAVERSAGELGARVGLGDSNANIAKAGGKLALNSGLVLLNGVAAGGALGAAGKAGKAAMAGEAAMATTTVVRHYTSVEAAAQVLKSGELWATAKGMCGTNKIYLLAENAGAKGLNFLRRLNIGMPAKTAAAIEIDLAKLPVEVAAKFRLEGFRGFLNQENFITHVGTFDFNAFREAVKVVPTETVATTLQQVLSSGGRLLGIGAATVDASRGAQGAANVPY